MLLEECAGGSWFVMKAAMTPNSMTPNKNLHILSHPLVDHAMAELRNKQTPVPRFRERARELAKYLLLEATRDLPTVDVEVQTPIGTSKERRLGDYTIVIAPILRAGLSMVEPAMELLPEAEVRHIGLYRDEETLQPVHYYVKVPAKYPEDSVVIIIDPMLATGGSAMDTIALFEERGIKKIKFLCLIASPEGIAKTMAKYPDVQIYAVSVDEKLNEHGYIVPGLGDAGDRVFGTA
jgi:uracil phosphoribosyltransferase